MAPLGPAALPSKELELLNAAANVTSQVDLNALRLTLSFFFAERAQQAIDKMWDEGAPLPVAHPLRFFDVIIYSKLKRIQKKIVSLWP